MTTEAEWIRRWSRLVFDGDQKNYVLWETEFLGHLLLQVLNQTILHEPESPADADEDDDESNAKAYEELIQFLNDRSLSLTMRETADDGRKAVKSLMGY